MSVCGLIGLRRRLLAARPRLLCAVCFRAGSPGWWAAAGRSFSSLPLPVSAAHHSENSGSLIAQTQAITLPCASPSAQVSCSADTAIPVRRCCAMPPCRGQHTVPPPPPPPPVSTAAAATAASLQAKQRATPLTRQQNGGAAGGGGRGVAPAGDAGHRQCRPQAVASQGAARLRRRWSRLPSNARMLLECRSNRL